MDKLLEQAAKFFKDHPEINEIELSDSFHNRVHLVRISPAPIYPLLQNYWSQPTYPA